MGLNIETVKASGTIYIRSDGSVDPLTANITSVDNVTYTFTGNINDEVVIQRDNIVVDGAGYTLQGTGPEYSSGIYLSYRNNVIIKNININNFSIGIELWWSPNNIIYGNNITNSLGGVMLYESSNNTISGNNITNNGDGIWISRFSGDESSNNTISGNNITNNENGIWLYSCSNNSIYHNNFVDNSKQVDSSGGAINVWDCDYPSGGNYWSDYTGIDLHSGLHQNETGYDWIGDTPYTIAENNQDNYPLTEPYDSIKQDAMVSFRNLLSDFNNQWNSVYDTLLSNYTELKENYATLNQTYSILQENFDSLTSSYNQLNTSYDTLLDSYNQLQLDQESVLDELNVIRNMLYLFIATTIVFMVITVYLVIMKPKTKP